MQNEREWGRFCDKVLRTPDLKDDARFISNPQRVRYRAAVEEIINKVFAGFSAAEAIERLEDAQIAYARLNSVQEFVDLVGDKPVTEITHEDGIQYVEWWRGRVVNDEPSAPPQAVPPTFYDTAALSCG